MAKSSVGMTIFHDFYDNDSLDWFMTGAYIIYQAVGCSDRTCSMRNTLMKEISMRSHGHATVWGTHVGVDRARDGAGWYQRLQEWWATHQATRRQAKLEALNAYWDAKREAVRPLRAEAALEMVAAQGAFSTATKLYGLSV
jgi:hypothetical protein